MPNRSLRIAIVGAGPIGLEAALYGAVRGHDVQVFERGAVAENVRQWGHVRLFSPFGLNASSWGKQALAANDPAANSHHPAIELPADDAILTGREFARRYLVPLCGLPQLAGRVHEQTEVVALGRSRTWKGDLIGRPERASDPFQLLLRDARGERTAEADVLLDCSGTYPHHNWLGAGGIPCVGERAAAAAIEYRLPDLLGAERDRYAGRRTLVAGAGYSAATAVVSLAELARRVPGTHIVWLTRGERTPPIPRFEGDPLAERDALAAEANRLALAGGGPVSWKRGALVRRIVPSSDGALSVTIERAGDGRASEELTVDRVIAAVGYKPDRALYEELQVHECYASQGPMKLAAALLGETSADCLAQQGQGAGTLLNPEPGLFVLGAKSYGRNSRFLMKAGLEQIEHAFALIEAREAGQ